MSTLNLAKACIMLKQIFDDRSVGTGDFSKAVYALADMAQSIQNSSPTEFVANQDDVQLRQQSAAWFEVSRTLDEVAPGWLGRGGTGVECAVKTIRSTEDSRASAVKRLVGLQREVWECANILPITNGKVDYVGLREKLKLAFEASTRVKTC